MLIVYGHPLASFHWKALIALYERGVPFEFRMVDPAHPENTAFVARAAPTGQFPVLVDGDRTVIETAAIIEYLDLHHGDAPPMVPADPRAAIEARQMDGVFDDYVMAPLTRMVVDRIREPDKRDPLAVAEAKATLDKSYAWLDRWMEGRTWAAGETLRPRRHRGGVLRCSTPTGATRSRRSMPVCAPTAPACLPAPPSPASSPRQAPGSSTSRSGTMAARTESFLAPAKRGRGGSGEARDGEGVRARLQTELKGPVDRIMGAYAPEQKRRPDERALTSSRPAACSPAAPIPRVAPRRSQECRGSADPRSWTRREERDRTIAPKMDTADSAGFHRKVMEY